jgi:hypothetical protein
VVTKSIFVLSLEYPGYNFFELGGNFLSATQVITQIRSSLQLDLPIREFFLNPNIAAQIDILKQQQQQTKIEIEKIEPVDRGNAQEILENLDQLSEEEVEKLLRDLQT